LNTSQERSFRFRYNCLFFLIYFTLLTPTVEIRPHCRFRNFARNISDCKEPKGNAIAKFKQRTNTVLGAGHEQKVGQMRKWRSRKGVWRPLRNTRELKQPRRQREQKPPQICIFDNDKQYFCTLCTCIFIFWHFEDVKWPVLQLCGRRKHLMTNVQFLSSYVPSAGSSLIPGLIEHIFQA